MQFFRPDEVADFLKVSRRTLATMRQEGSGPRAIRVRGQLRYPSDELDEWVNARYEEALEEDAARVAS